MEKVAILVKKVENQQMLELFHIHQNCRLKLLAIALYKSLIPEELQKYVISTLYVTWGDIKHF